MCKFCDSLEYKTITIPNRTNMADDNICEFTSPDIIDIDGEKFSNGVECKGCEGCSDENSYFSIDTWEDNMCLNYFRKIRDVVIAPVSARFSINYCPMCGKRISEKLNEELSFW